MIVRFKLSDSTYETVITNLDEESFPPEELKHLYGMRWGIETSFRELKYTVGLLHFHAKKVENITQEIFARVILYNFTELITSHVVIQKPNRKYPCVLCRKKKELCGQNRGLRTKRPLCKRISAGLLVVQTASQ